MTPNPSSKSRSITFPGMLAVLFIGLKLCEKISWEWKWVLSPIWIEILILFFCFLLIEIGKKQGR